MSFRIMSFRPVREKYNVQVKDMIVGNKYLVRKKGANYPIMSEGSENEQIKTLIKKDLVVHTGKQSISGNGGGNFYWLTFLDEETGTEDPPIPQEDDFLYEMVPKKEITSITGGKRKSRRKRTINKYRKNNRKNKRKTIRRRRHRRNNN